ncbi:DNA-binding transcriptional regulator [Acidaminobacter sp. JC074]|uniref:helix-turn-helix domain-containing protein n=1 Tax=Acidaminobacter sp. JC074 TaxID=2530199 RepID=UPI001F0DEC44|nr:helix-turn-helix domain-containing protein [Acidaminobacter sp. JC074]
MRTQLSLTQIAFASLLGVSAKTVEAWEKGTNKPNGSARRLMELLNADLDIPEKYRLIVE